MHDELVINEVEAIRLIHMYPTLDNFLACGKKSEDKDSHEIFDEIACIFSILGDNTYAFLEREQASHTLSPKCWCYPECRRER